MSQGDDLIWHDAMPFDELEESKPHAVQLGRTTVALVKIGTQVFAVDCICTHEFALLSEGYGEEKTIDGPLQAARFGLETGKVMEGPPETALAPYAVRISGDVVQVGLPESSA